MVLFPGEGAGGDGGVEQGAQLQCRSLRHGGEEIGGKDADAGVGERLPAFGETQALAVEAEIAAVMMGRVSRQDGVLSLIHC